MTDNILNKGWLAAALGLLAVGVILGPILSRHWNTYGDLSQEGYQLASSLAAAASTQNLERIEKIEKLSSNLFGEQRIHDQEYRYISQICRMARNGNWDKATREARKMLLDQVRTTSQ